MRNKEKQNGSIDPNLDPHSDNQSSDMGGGKGKDGEEEEDGEFELPAGSLLPPFVPDIPIAGPLNPATWSQEQINAILNPQLLNVMNPNTAANTVTEIPGLGRFSIAIPPVNVELP